MSFEPGGTEEMSNVGAKALNQSRRAGIGLWFAVLVPLCGARGVTGSDAGTLRLAGPEPLAIWMDKAGKQFTAQWPGTTVAVEQIGADKLVQKLLSGAADAVLLPRPVSEPELTLARIAKKPELRGYPVALNAVVIFVHSKNPIETLSTEQVGGLITRSVLTWQQLGAKTEGTVLEVPRTRREGDSQLQGDEEPSPITIALPGPTGGFDEWLRRRTAGLPPISADLKRTASRAETVQAVIDNVRAIGILTLPVPEGVKILAVRDKAAADPARPSLDLVRSREYPLTHHLYLYTSGEPNGPLRDLIGFLLSPAGQKTIETEWGFLPLPTLEPVDAVRKPGP